MADKLGSIITLAHGNGGQMMRKLIEEVFINKFGSSECLLLNDATEINLPAGKIHVTTDGFTVNPLQFPGGDIGSLSIHGCVNDLAVSGAKPIYLTLSAFIEEGFTLSTLEQIINSMAVAAQDNAIKIIAGDTKVLPRGDLNGIYFSLTGIGVCEPQLNLSILNVQAGDAILVSGPVGDHGTAVMLAREEFGLKGKVISDSASVLPLAQALWSLKGLRFMRDPTRGGLATVMHEIALASKHSIRLYEPNIPVRDSVQSVCEMLGFDPYYLACEGRIVTVIDQSQAEKALTIWQAMPEGQDSKIIGKILSDTHGEVILQTELGGERFLPELIDDPLPRIC